MSIKGRYRSEKPIAGIIVDEKNRKYDVLEELSGYHIDSVEMDQPVFKISKQLKEIEEEQDIRIVNYENLMIFLERGVLPNLRWQPNTIRKNTMFQKLKDAWKESDDIVEDYKRKH